MDGSSPKVFVAWGTVCQTNPSLNTAFPITIESLDKLWTFNTGEYIWLEVDFTALGNIITLKMKCGVPAAQGWTNFPNSYSSGTAGGNKWYHPIAHYRAARTSKSTVNALAGNPFTDLGEEVEAHATYTIAQLTNTHLVALQVCEFIDQSVAQHMIWKLTPGPGAVQGTGS